MAKADELVGKVVLLGLQVYRNDGTFLQLMELHGVVLEIDPDAGIVIQEAMSGRDICLPPAFEHIHPAAPGTYHERNSGRTIVDPDFVTQWAVQLSADADQGEVDWTFPMAWSPGPAPDCARW